MRTLEMNGPFMLTVGCIERQLGPVIAPGVVVFGSYGMNGDWQVEKVDRSDVHIRARLWANTTEYPFFSYRLCASAEEAYRLHCELYHRYKPRFTAHPCPPEASPLQCSVCSLRPNCVHQDQV